MQYTQVVERHRHIGQVGAGVGLGELAVKAERFLVSGQRLGAAVFISVQCAQVVERGRHIGQVSAGVGLGELAADAERFLVRPTAFFELVLLLVKVPAAEPQRRVFRPNLRGMAVRLGCARKVKFQGQGLGAQFPVFGQLFLLLFQLGFVQLLQHLIQLTRREQRQRLSVKRVAIVQFGFGQLLGKLIG